MEEAFLKELAKKVPVREIYKDLAKASTTQMGIAAEDIIKTLHLALAPIQFTSALQDRYRNFLDKSIRQIPEKSRISPAPQILGPILENIRYEPAGTVLDEMYSNLLARSMFEESQSKAHPAYPNLIKQLTRDEATILKILNQNKPLYYVYEADLSEEEGEDGRKIPIFKNHRIVKDDFPKEQLFWPKELSFYMEHLSYLGLAGRYKVSSVPQLSNNVQIGAKEKLNYQLTPFGRSFVEACRKIEI